MGGIKRRIPQWIKFKIPGGNSYVTVKKAIKSRGLHTVCTEAKCPNIGECFGTGTATFIILGNICTRNCRYCSIISGDPVIADINEPKRIAQAVKELNLSYAVITSVTRDDLPDGGASIFSSCIEEINKTTPGCGIELLVPDFKNSMKKSIQQLIEAKPDVINHNIEIVKSHYQVLRPLGNYDLSLELLREVARSVIPSKSGLMIGFGETVKDIEDTLIDVYDTGCRMVTIGQYLQSSKDGFPVNKFYTPDEFKEIKSMAEGIGFKKVFCSPLVRSSYHAGEML